MKGFEHAQFTQSPGFESSRRVNAAITLTAALLLVLAMAVVALVSDLDRPERAAPPDTAVSAESDAAR